MSVVIRGGAFKSILFRVPVRNAGSAPPPPYPVIVDHVSGNPYIHTLKNFAGVNHNMMALVGAFNYATRQDLMDKNILCLLYDTSLFCS